MGKGKSKSPQEKVIELFNFIQNYGRAPLSTEISNSLRCYLCTEYSSYDEGLKHYGVTPLTPEEKAAIATKRTNAKWKSRILEYYIETGTTPTIKNLKEKYSKYPPSSICTNYSKVLKEVGLTPKRENICYNYTKDTCLEVYIDLCNRLGKIANSTDIKNDDIVPSFVILTKHFGSLRNLQKQASVEIISSEFHRYSKSEISNYILMCYDEIGEDIYIQSKLRDCLKAHGIDCSIITIKRYFLECNSYKDIVDLILSKNIAVNKEGK